MPEAVAGPLSVAAYLAAVVLMTLGVFVAPTHRLPHRFRRKDRP